MNSSINKGSIYFSRNILGPILYDFCAKLHWYLERNVIQERDDFELLFMARAGLRLRYLYQLYRQLNNLPPICLEEDLYISRLSCVKGCLSNDFDYVADIIVEEYKNKPIINVFSRIIDSELNLQPKWLNITTSNTAFRQIYAESECSSLIANYFREQSQLFAKYINNLIQNRKRIFLVDSGWIGRTQGMLMRTFPEIEWTGLYFGKWAYGKSYPEYFPSIVGLCLDDSVHHKGHPRAALFHYHHLIEAPLEIDFPSVKEYIYDEKLDLVLPNTGIASESVIAPNDERNTHFRGIVEYFQTCQQKELEQISQGANLAYKQLNHLIRFPSKSDLQMMMVGDRSADFGKDKSYPILLQPSKGSLIAKRRRLIRSMWKEGQVALEFPPTMAYIIQRVMNCL